MLKARDKKGKVKFIIDDKGTAHDIEKVEIKKEDFAEEKVKLEPKKDK
jgi:hypothetical protein